MPNKNEIIAILKDAGLSDSWINNFLRLPVTEQNNLLEGYRTDILEQLHGCKKKLDCLDYLRYQYKFSQQEGK